MSEANHLEYLLKREKQQRDLAARARDEEVRAFHERLADHYARLIDEAR